MAEQPKKLNVVQLTLMVAVNMMGRRHHAADEHGEGRRDLAVVVGERGVRRLAAQSAQPVR